MSEHYYTKNPKSKLFVKEFSENILGYFLTFTSGSGVFSIGQLDNGTKLLIESAKVSNEEGFDVLDLGCGYGIVGIALKKRYEKINVVCSDINNRAVNFTIENCKQNKVKLEALQSDVYENLQDRKFDAILVNLPQNAGKDICFKMIEESVNYLKDNGTLQTVSRHQKGGKSYEKKMIEVFGNCEHLGKGSGYRVYCSHNNKKL